MVALRGPDREYLNYNLRIIFFLTIALQEDLGLCISSDLRVLKSVVLDTWMLFFIKFHLLRERLFWKRFAMYT